MEEGPPRGGQAGATGVLETNRTALSYRAFAGRGGFLRKVK